MAYVVCIDGEPVGYHRFSSYQQANEFKKEVMKASRLNPEHYSIKEVY